MVFHWRLSDSKSPQVSRTRLSILALLSNVVTWMVFTRPPISMSSIPFNNPLVTVSKAPVTIGIIITLIFHNFFQLPSKFEVLILIFTFFQFYSVVSWGSKVDNFPNSFFFVVDYYFFCSRLGNICVSPIVYVCPFSRTYDGLCIYHLFVW